MLWVLAEIWIWLTEGCYKLVRDRNRGLLGVG